MPISKFLTVKEVAETFRRSTDTIYRWLDEGKVFEFDKVIKIKGGYLIPETEVKRILKAWKVE